MKTQHVVYIKIQVKKQAPLGVFRYKIKNLILFNKRGQNRFVFLA